MSKTVKFENSYVSTLNGTDFSGQYLFTSFEYGVHNIVVIMPLVSWAETIITYDSLILRESEGYPPEVIKAIKLAIKLFPNWGK